MAKIYKGQLVNVSSMRKGNYVGIATKDFDTEEDEWYPISLAGTAKISGMNTIWEPGDEIPCRRGIDTISIKEN